MPDQTTARLLYAARATYGVTPVGMANIDPPDDHLLSNLASWIGGPQLIDAALLADAPEGVVLAFRGTLPLSSPDLAQSLRDWINDADAILIAEPDMPGLVHQGFRDTLNNLWGELQGALFERMARVAPTTPLYVTGHSKGGAVAFLAALRCRAMLAANALPNPVIVCTFAAPRPGDQDFATSFDSTITHAIRYEYADDAVPHLPPENALLAMLRKIPHISGLGVIVDGFVPPGDLHYLPRGATNVDSSLGETFLLDIERIGSLIARMARFDFRTIARDHSIDANSGYATAITGGT